MEFAWSKENVFGSQFPTYDSPGNHPQGIYYGVAHKTPRETESVPRAIGTGTSFAGDDDQNEGTIPIPTCARRPSTTRSFPVEIPQNSMVGQQRQQISELQFDNSLIQYHSWCWKIRFKHQVTTCSDFPSDTMLWINEVEMVDSLDELESSRSVYGKFFFSNFEMLDVKIASALNKIIQNSQFKKKVSLEEQKAQKEDRLLRGRLIAFMVYVYFRVIDAHGTVLDYADLFTVTLHDDNFQEFDARWDEVPLPMSKIPSDDILESLYTLRRRESNQLKTVLELYDMETHQKISVPNNKKVEDNGKKKYRSETPITKP